MSKRIIGLLAALALLIPSLWLVVARQPRQAEREPRTKLEAFQVEPGTVIIKGYSEIGEVLALGDVKVMALEFTDATTGRKQSGVRIEIKESVRLENTDRSFIDYDEIEALLKGIDYISKATSDVTKLKMFEATYKTKGSFSVTTFNNNSGEITATVNIRSVSVFLSLPKLAELRTLIAQAKKNLDLAK